MEMNVELVPARVENKSVVANLLQLYLYDFSELAGWSINEHGLFNYPYLDHYWTEPDRHPFLIRVDGELAGFALVRSLANDGGQEHHLAEFFILRKLRRSGVGENAACQLFDRFPGSWQVAQRDWNVVAQRFWRRVIGRYTGGAFTERHDDAIGRTIQEFAVEGQDDKDIHHPSTPPADSNRPRPDADRVEQPLEDDQVSGTDIVGDETNVRTREGVEKPGIADKVPPQPERNESREKD